MSFVLKYRNFLKKIQLISHFKPAWLSAEIAAQYAVHSSPIKVNKLQALEMMRRCLGDSKKVKKIWRLHLKQHGIASLNIFKLKTLTKDWCQNKVEICQPDVFEQFCQNKEGGVVLTFHVQHQHHFCALLGLFGLSINPLAASPQSSPLYDELKEYINLLHQNACQHYGKGNYIFLEPDKMNIRPAYRALLDKQIVVSLCDNAGNDRNTADVLLFDKKFKVSTGMVKVAKKKKLPVWVALMYWKRKDTFSLEIKKLDVNQSVEEIMQDYMNFFQNILIKKPETWEGWQW